MISAKIIADSINVYNDSRITTWELEYPRFIHSELMTHRMFSRNAASSRAIPIASMLTNIKTNPAIPIHWGKNQPGMQANNELEGSDLELAQHLWQQAMLAAVHYSGKMADAGVHKQIANRITEPFQHMKVVLTATDFKNWFWLRDNPDAQPEIRELARLMQLEYTHSEPVEMTQGMWHLPYVHCLYDLGIQLYLDEKNNYIGLEQAQMISASCCAQVSYRKSDGSLEKAETVYRRLIESEPCHASPVEHQAMAYQDEDAHWEPKTWPKGVTSVNFHGVLYSGNLHGWVQMRQLIPNNVKRY